MEQVKYGMIKTFKKLLSLLDKKDKRNLPFIFAMMIVETLFEALGISLIVPLVSAIMDENIITNNKFLGDLCRFLHIENHSALIVTCIVALMAVFLIKNVFMLFECKVRYNFICRARHLVQRKIFNSILDRPYEFFLNAQTGEIIREVADDCNRTFNLLGSLMDVFANLLVATGIVVILISIDPAMTMVILLMMVLLSLVLITIVKPILKKQGSILVKYAAGNYRVLLEAVQGIKIIKITRSKDYFSNQFRKYGEKVIEADRKNTVINRMPSALTETVCVLTVLLYLLVLFIRNHDVTALIPTVGAFVVASLKLIPSANRVINAYSSIAFNKDSVDKVLANYNSICDAGNQQPVEKLGLTEKIELRGVTYRYPGTDRKILNKASLVIPAGKTTGIIGLSGIGKTTAADVLLGLLNPEEGSIAFDDKEIEVDIERYPVNIGYVPQTIYIRDDTIRSNIAFGICEEDIDDRKIESAIRAAQLEEFISALPEGINTCIGENGVRISGGQRQRIGIARALYGEPELLIFDEATSSLDLETEQHVMQAIYALRGTRTMLIIAHRPQIIENCDTIYRLVDGKFVNAK